MLGNGRRYEELNERITDVHVMLDSMRDMLISVKETCVDNVRCLKDEVHGGVNGIADKCDAVLRMMTEIGTKMEVMKELSVKFDTLEAKVERLSDLVISGIGQRSNDFNELKEGLGRIVSLQERDLGVLDSVLYGQAAMLRCLKAVMEHQGVDTGCLNTDGEERVPVCVDFEKKDGCCDAEVTGASAEVEEPAVVDGEDANVNAADGKPDCDGCVHAGDAVEEPCDRCVPEREGRRKKRHGKR